MKTTNALSSTFAKGIEVVQDVGNNSENIEAFILTIRGKQVLLDRDLAMLYNVETSISLSGTCHLLISNNKCSITKNES